ncbi:hypothetical protein [Acidovorax sp. SDU_ACID1]
MAGRAALGGGPARGQLHLLRKALNAHGYDGIETVHNIGWRLASPDR